VKLAQDHDHWWAFDINGVKPSHSAIMVFVCLFVCLFVSQSVSQSSG
jgi:hypothetical protein